MVKVIDFNTPFTLNSRERTGRKAWLDKKAIPDDVYWHDISQTWGKVDSTVREIGGEYYLNVYVDSTGLTAGEYQDMFTVIQGDQTTDYLIKFSVKDPNPPPPPPPPPPRIEYVDRPVVRYQHDPDYYSWGETLKMLLLKSGWVLKGIGIILGVIAGIVAIGLLILFMIFVMAKNDAKDFPGYVTSFFNRPTATPVATPTLTPAPTQSAAQPPPTATQCALLADSRLKIGDTARVSMQLPIKRKIDDANGFDNLDAGDLVEMINGPVCFSANTLYWQVISYDKHLTGWTFEIGYSQFYLVPYDSKQMTATPTKTPQAPVTVTPSPTATDLPPTMTSTPESQADWATKNPCVPIAPIRVHVGGYVKYLGTNGVGNLSSDPNRYLPIEKPVIHYGDVLQVINGPICQWSGKENAYYIQWQLKAINPNTGLTGWMIESASSNGYLLDPYDPNVNTKTPIPATLAYSAAKTATKEACNPVAPIRIKLGDQVKFISNSLSYFQTDPENDSPIYFPKPEYGQIYRVIDGPVCGYMGKYIEWKLESVTPNTGLVGWFTEAGDVNIYNLEPYKDNPVIHPTGTVTPAKSSTLVGCKNRLPSQVKLYDIVEVNVAGYSMLVDPSDSDKFVPNSQMNSQYWYQIVDGPKCSASGYVYWQLAVWGRYESVIGWMPESDYQNKYIFQPDTTYKLQNTPMKPIRVHLNQVVKITKAGNKKGYYSLSQSAGQPTTVGPGLVVGDTYRILAGPLTTSDGYVFWQLQKTNQTDLIGWLAEVDLENDYLFAP